MNEHVRPPAKYPPRQPTRAAEGLPRWRWTTAEVERMVAAGVLPADARVELVGGELVPMSPKGRRHEVVADELARLWSRVLPSHVWVSVERQFNLDEANYTEPDLLVLPWSIKTYDLRGPEAFLVVEVAETSLAYDRREKAAIYARFGVREYWVIDAVRLVTSIHRDPVILERGDAGEASGRYQSVVEHPSTAVLTPHLVPELALRLADLDLS